MVLDRRSAQRQTMTAAQQPRRLRRGGRRVLDRLRLVEDDVVELVLRQPRRISAQRAVGRQQDVEVFDLRRSSRVAGVIQDLQLRRETACLLDPVVDERSRHDRDRRARAIVLARDAARLEQREHHDGLAEPHVVGQAPAEAEAAQEREPAERLALILAQLAVKRRRRVERTDPAELRQLGARPRERLVDAHRRLRLEQRIEQRRLRRTEAHVIVLALAEGRDSHVAPQPLFRHHPARAVVEDDGRLAAAERREQIGDRPRIGRRRSRRVRAARTSRRPT